MGLEGYQRLEVWRVSMDLSVACYRLTSRFPGEEKFGLVSQIRRSACSIPANLAEGYGRNHVAEYLHFVGIANGSLKELETHLILSHRLGLVSDDNLRSLQGSLRSIGKMLTRLRQALRRRIDRPPT